MKKSLKPAVSDFIQDKNLSSVCAFRVLLVLTQLFIFFRGKTAPEHSGLDSKGARENSSKGKINSLGGRGGGGGGKSILPWARHQECAGREPAKNQRKSLLEKRPRI